MARACRAMPARPSRSARARRRCAERGGAGLRQAQGGALRHLLRQLQQHRHRRGRARGAGQERRRDRGRPSRLLRHAQARAGRYRSRRGRRRRGVGGAAAVGRQGLRRDRAHAVLRPDAEVRMAADPAQGSRGRAPVAGDVRPLGVRRRHRQEGRAGARPWSRSRAASACISPAMPAPRTWAPRPPRCCAWCPRRGSR